MKNVFKVSAVLLLLCVIASVSSAEMISPMYIGIGDIRATLIIKSGQASCEGTVTLNSTSYKADVTTTLQKKNGSSWTYVDSWSKSGSIHVAAGGSATIIQNNTYRVKVSVTVKDLSGNVVETETAYSPIKTY